MAHKQSAPGDLSCILNSGPYSYTSPLDKQLLSDTLEAPEQTASPFDTKFTVLKFNSGTKLFNKSGCKSKCSKASNSSSTFSDNFSKLKDPSEAKYNSNSHFKTDQ